jgi:NAD(P)-dependent dehydrogenase (short-subunit alcohol dehydrogenase family)
VQDFTDKLAVVTGGGSGIGRALVRRLAEEGCSVAACDIRQSGLDETRRLAEAGAAQGVKVTTFVADVTDEAQLGAFRDDTAAQHELDHIHLLFNNAGIGGGGSFATGSRKEWERTFEVCWGGVYKTARVFLPSLIRAPEGHLVNVSSVNGFWASLGPGTAHTAYSAAKFAVKGFTEALIGDLRLNAPHVGVSVVMPGHIGTSIVANTVEELAPGLEGEARQEVMRRDQAFRDNGLPPERAAEIILEGVRAGRWRILVGPDALALDEAVRAAPESAYEPEFNNHLASLRAGRAG